MSSPPEVDSKRCAILAEASSRTETIRALERQDNTALLAELALRLVAGARDRDLADLERRRAGGRSRGVSDDQLKAALDGFKHSALTNMELAAQLLTRHGFEWGDITPDWLARRIGPLRRLSVAQQPTAAMVP
jgi:hypothetical protein